MGVLGRFKNIYQIMGLKWLSGILFVILSSMIGSYFLILSEQEATFTRYLTVWEESIVQDLIQEPQKNFERSSERNSAGEDGIHQAIEKILSVKDISSAVGSLELRYSGKTYLINDSRCEASHLLTLHQGLMKIAEVRYCFDQGSIFSMALLSPLFLVVLVLALGAFNLILVRLRNEVQLELEKEQQTQHLRRTQLLLETEKKNILQARQLAHDLQSPLSALMVVSSLSKEGHLGLKELTVLESAIERVREISRSLLRKSEVGKSSSTIGARESATSPGENKIGASKSDSERIASGAGISKSDSERIASGASGSARESDGVSVSDGKSYNLKALIQSLLSEFQLRYPEVDFNCVGKDLTEELQIEMSDLYRVLLNLVQNSCEAARPGSKLQIRVAFRKRAQDIFIEVSDNGQGIEDQIKESIFKPGFSFGKSEGHGLGLYTVKQILESHGGSLELTSKVGFGTTFGLTVSLKSSVDVQIQNTALKI
ncbi:MAG: sensor histidine kinase [Pseudobdellovibrionaceae bacterium]